MAEKISKGDTSSLIIEFTNDDGTRYNIQPDWLVKLIIYNNASEVVLTMSTSDGSLVRLEDNIFAAVIQHSISKTWLGEYTAELAIYTIDKSYVNIGDNTWKFTAKNNVICNKL